MDTTVDAKLIGKMIHSDCSQHHCRKYTKRPGTEKRLAADKWPPEFLHCGVWPPPQRPSGKMVRKDNEATRAGQPVQAHPDNTPNIDGDGTDSEDYDSELEIEDDDVMAITPAEPLTMTRDQLSDAVDLLKMIPNASDEDAVTNANGKFSTPYSVLKLIARHGNGTSKQALPPQSLQNKKFDSTRQDLFDQELQAESQARVELTEYLDSLIDRGEFEEGYNWIWPLEDYRRTGWSKEMMAAYPGECVEFVGKAMEQLENRKQGDDQKGALL